MLLFDLATRLNTLFYEWLMHFNGSKTPMGTVSSKATGLR